MMNLRRPACRGPPEVSRTVIHEVRGAGGSLSGRPEGLFVPLRADRVFIFCGDFK